jgi:hypothetical protein
MSTLYLAAHDGLEVGDEPAGPWREVRVLRPGLALVLSDQSRSVVYHALKDLGPRAASLLVVTCTEVPKMKGMAPGSVAWARQQLPGDSGGRQV